MKAVASAAPLSRLRERGWGRGYGTLYRHFFAAPGECRRNYTLERSRCGFESRRLQHWGAVVQRQDTKTFRHP